MIFIVIGSFDGDHKKSRKVLVVIEKQRGEISLDGRHFILNSTRAGRKENLYTVLKP